MRERWRNIEDYPNYRISSEGRIKNKTTGRILKPGTDRDGYKRIVLSDNGIKKCHGVHRLVGRAFVSGYDETLQVNHLDGVKANNTVNNLEWVTQSENAIHAYQTGLTKRSTKAGKQPRPVRVVETDQVFDSESECARMLGVKREGINACLNGRAHTHHGFHYEYA